MPTFAKAIVGAVMAGLSALLVSLVGDTNLGELTDGQWVATILATITSFGAVYGVPNGRSNDPDTSTPGPYPNQPGDLDA